MKQNKDLLWTLILTLIGAVAGVFAANYQLMIIDPAVLGQVSVLRVQIIGAVQTALYAGLSSFFGFRLARRTGLAKPFDFRPRTLGIALLTGLVGAFVISASDKFIFMPLITALQPTELSGYTLSWTYLGVGVFYGGIVEELMMRLFLMSLTVFLMLKIFRPRTVKNQPVADPRLAESPELTASPELPASPETPGQTQFSASVERRPDAIYWVANAIVALLFAAGHLPVTAMTFGLTPLIVVRCFVLNGLVGFLFGLLYWKKGIGPAIIAHASTHLFNQLILMPLLF